MAPTSAAPPCAPRLSISTKTPAGASQITQPTSTSIASASPRKKPSTAARLSAGMRVVAVANSSVNSTSGSIVPLAAAAIGLVGINDNTQFQKPTGVGSAESDSAASA